MIRSGSAALSIFRCRPVWACLGRAKFETNALMSISPSGSRRFQVRLKVSNVSDGKFKVATIPNFLCMGRIAATPFIGFLVIYNHFSPAFALFVAAGLSDMLDGYIARNVPGQKSLLGSVLDPVADKLLVSVMFITMTYSELIPVALTGIVLLRDICLVIGGFYKRFKTMDPPYSLDRFFNPQVNSMQIVPTFISKLNTVLQLSVVATALASPVFNFGPEVQQLITGLQWITAGTTVWSGLQYANGRAIKKV